MQCGEKADIIHEAISKRRSPVLDAANCLEEPMLSGWGPTGYCSTMYRAIVATAGIRLIQLPLPFGT
ncbi:hypothetical protein ABKN59_002053 [Abortiporus biennis]